MKASLTAAFKLRRRSLQLDVAFTLSSAWTCLFGASGSGKSTILRVLAGLEWPAEGRIALAEEVLLDGARRVNIQPHLRPIRLSAQRSWLFPSSVRSNLRYGVARTRYKEADALLELMELHALAATPAVDLSGGEQQRVAIARAVAAAMYGQRPAKLLLLDEPFNGMDAARRDRLAIRLRDFLAAAGLPVLSVTHDLAEVYLLGAEVMRLEGGRIVAQGAPADVLAAERDRLVKTLHLDRELESISPEGAAQSS